MKVEPKKVPLGKAIANPFFRRRISLVCIRVFVLVCDDICVDFCVRRASNLRLEVNNLFAHAFTDPDIIRSQPGKLSHNSY